MLRKIVSGGQTGADLAALDFAISRNIEHGGWIPKGRLTEDGSLNERYKLSEMPTDSYPKRTEQNVIDSDGTLIVSHGALRGGSELTAKFAKKQNKPWLHVDLGKYAVTDTAPQVKRWIRDNGIGCLNVAGSRASGDRLIYKEVSALLALAIG